MKKLIIALLLCFPIHVFSQGWSFEYSIGYGTYQLDDIKELQRTMINKRGLKETDAFPGHITHSLSVGYNTGFHSMGSTFSYLTTGGRLHRADFSGSYTVDMITNGYRIGVFYRHYIPTGHTPLSVYFQVTPGVIISNLDMKEQIKVYSQLDKKNTNLKGFGIYLEPTIGLKYQLSDRLYCSLGGGYEINFPSKMKQSGLETEIEANWNGLRLYCGLIFVLPTFKK
ncbi:hypothetical protein EMN47_12830 [Prolixibacteraceae bacterium JC049]|nr:hypothetical protein [Prolixibacteraceae bacterium JC049]